MPKTRSLDSIELWQSCLRKNPRSCYIILLHTRKKGNTSPVSGLICGQWRKTCNTLWLPLFSFIKSEYNSIFADVIKDLICLHLSLCSYWCTVSLVFRQCFSSLRRSRFADAISSLYHGVEGLKVTTHLFRGAWISSKPSRSFWYCANKSVTFVAVEVKTGKVVRSPFLERQQTLFLDLFLINTTDEKNFNFSTKIMDYSLCKNANFVFFLNPCLCCLERLLF